MKKVSISDFRFFLEGYGVYRVIYESPVTGGRWQATIDDMTLIDATKNSENPKQKDLENLKRICKGRRYG